MNMEFGQMAIGLLGPLSAQLNDKPVAPSAAKQRQVLALLALNAGRVVTVSTLIEELWGDSPPRSYSTTLQTYILQLRNGMTAAIPGEFSARQILGTRHCGYLLEDGACQTDVEEFSRLAQAGRAAVDRGDRRTTSEQLGRALSLWRGPALVDVRMGRILELEVASLEETRLGVLERRIEADLALGMSGARCRHLAGSGLCSRTSWGSSLARECSACRWPYCRATRPWSQPPGQ